MDKKVDVCVIGGGICGILAAHGCVERNLSFALLEKGPELGGCWQTLANKYSTLQVRFKVVTSMYSFNKLIVAPSVRFPYTALLSHVGI